MTVGAGSKGQAMRYGVLGPIEVWHGERLLSVGGPQQRALLAALLLNANRVVSADRLVDVLWGDQPPATARSLLQGCVAELRRALKGTGAPLVTRPPGYLLEVGPDELDLGRFAQLVAEAGAEQADPTEAARLLREGLALWRGPALGDVTVAALQPEAAALEERRLAALEDRIDADLRAGHHAALIGELRELVRRHPLRERMWAQLMQALHRAGRPAEAMAAYQRLRDTLVKQLGVEPAASLQQLHRAILARADPVSPGPTADAAPPVPPVPAQLPAATAAFTGRVDALKRLEELWSLDGVAVGVISGTAGVGKTAVAVHWGHQVRTRFPDGQLYVDLRGYAAGPRVPPEEALADFLAALGVPADQVPLDLEPAAALYRTLLADKRMLVVLDNAGSAEQVRPLLPGAGGSLVLITSRDRLGGLVARDGAVHIGLDVLAPAEAQELLGRLIGPERIEAEPAAAAELARLCGHLPLALRIAVANLAIGPDRRIVDQVAELAAGRLDALEVGGDERTAVRSAFDLSYSVLAPEARRAFRLIGLAPGTSVTPETAAALTGAPVVPAARLLQRLASAHLLDQRGPRRYTLHDLLRQYAAERAHQEDRAAAREQATGRLFDWYLRATDAAARVLSPEKLRLRMPVAGTDPVPASPVFDGPARALAWLDAELSNLLAVIKHTAEHGPGPIAWLLADALRGFFGRRMLTVDWLAAARAGLAAAEAAGDLPGQAAAQLSLADAHNRRSEYEQALARYDRALELFQQAQWPEGAASVLCNSGGVYLEQGELERAAEQTSQALALHRQAGMAGGEAVALGNLACIYASLGRLAEAAEHATEALALYRRIGSTWGEAISLGYLGDIRRHQGRLDEALDLLTRALSSHRETGNRGAESDVLRAIAAAHTDAGRLDEAMVAAGGALSLARETADPRMEADVLTVLAEVHMRRLAYETAIGHFERSLALSRQGRMRYEAAAALAGLAGASRQLGRLAPARSYAYEALANARAGRLRVVEGQALTVLADIDAELGELDAAIASADAALALHRSTGHRLGEARTLLSLGHARSRAGEPGRAAACWHEALALFAEIGAAEAHDARRLLDRVAG
jgi:DNA-binding SARP family transcriptional activator